MRRALQSVMVTLVGAALLLPEMGAAQRAAPAPVEAAVEVHPSIGLGGGAGAGLGIDFRGTYWAAQERGYRAGPDFVLGWAGFPLEGPGSGRVVRLGAGARFAFPSGTVTPAVYGRLGLHSFGGPWRERWFWRGPRLGRLGLEGGGALDVAVAPNVSLGGHAGLNLPFYGLAYLNLGGHLAVRF